VSKAFQGFEYAIRDADELLGHCDAVNLKPPPDSAEVRKLAVIVQRYAHLTPAYMARHAAVVDGLLRVTSTAQ